MEFSERFPLKCDHHNVGGAWGGEVRGANLFGALTSATRASKACFDGVVVEVEEVIRTNSSWKRVKIVSRSAGLMSEPPKAVFKLDMCLVLGGVRSGVTSVSACARTQEPQTRTASGKVFVVCEELEESWKRGWKSKKLMK